MGIYPKLLLVLLFCFGAALPAPADEITIVDPFEKRIKEQEEDNRNWQKKAGDRESKLVKRAEQYYKEKSYRKAAEYYTKALDIRYRQWDIRKTSDGKTLLARKKKTVSLDTKNTARARQRLASIEDKIAAEEAAEIKKKIGKLFEQADVAMLVNDPIKAYKIYDSLIEFAAELPESKYAVESAIKAKGKQKAIRAAAEKMLVEAEKFIKDGKPGEAIAKLDEFEMGSRELLRLAPELKARYEQLTSTPEFAAVMAERAAQKRLLRGDAAMLREKYFSAYMHYRAVAINYPKSAAAKVASEKMAKLLADPRIKGAMREQEIEAECVPLLARAKALLALQRSGEAKAICDRIVEKYLESVWAEQASKLLKAIREAEAKAVEPATAR